MEWVTGTLWAAMRHQIYVFFFSFFVSGLNATPVWAKSAPQTELHVTLLGQPCLLQGPFDTITLKTIHSIGPAQLYPNFSYEELPGCLTQGLKSLEILKSSSKNLPSVLDRYQKRAQLRLDAQVQFFQVLQNLKNKQSQKQAFENLGSLGKKFLKKSSISFLKQFIQAQLFLLLQI